MAGVPRYGGTQLSLAQVYNGLRNAGATDAEAKAFGSVLHIESGGYTGLFKNSQTERVGALNPNGAYGLAQLNGPRQQQLLDFAGSHEAAADPQTQLNFLYQDGKARGIDLTSTRDIVNRYEVPRADLRAGEIARSNDNVARLGGVSYDPNNVPGLGSYSNAPTGSDGLGYASGGVETSAGSEITGFKSATGNPNDATEVTLGFPGDTAGAGGGIDGASFSQANVGGFGTGGASGGASGSFGLGGIMAGGSAIGAGNGGAGGTSFGPVGFNAGGPVTANPDLVSATNKVASNTQAGDKAITDGVKTAGQTIGQAITSQSQSWLDWAKESFVRLAFIVTGLVLFAAALYYFARPQIDAAVDTAVNTAAKGAKIAAKLA